LTMEDIMFSMPWHCGFEDGCEQGWHQSNYWVYDDGTYTVDNYSDGDHDPIEESDLPSHDEVELAWKGYCRAVAKTGDDPLGQVCVGPVKKNRLWQLKFAKSIFGSVFLGARRRGVGPWEMNPENIPEEVMEYFCLSKLTNMRWRVDPKIYDHCNVFEALIDDDPNCRRQRSGSSIIILLMATIEETTPASKTAVKMAARQRA